MMKTTTTMMKYRISLFILFLCFTFFSISCVDNNAVQDSVGPGSQPKILRVNVFILTPADGSNTNPPWTTDPIYLQRVFDGTSAFVSGTTTFQIATINIVQNDTLFYSEQLDLLTTACLNGAGGIQTQDGILTLIISGPTTQEIGQTIPFNTQTNRYTRTPCIVMKAYSIGGRDPAKTPSDTSLVLLQELGYNFGLGKGGISNADFTVSNYQNSAIGWRLLRRFVTFLNDPGAADGPPDDVDDL